MSAWLLVSVGDREVAQDLVALNAGTSVDPGIMAALLRLPARQRQVVALRHGLAGAV